MRIVGHRGAAALAPENTLPALAAAVATGVGAVEFDVRLSADGVPVVVHDADLGRYRAGRRAVARLSAAQLAIADVGSWFGQRFAGTGVPSLADWLAAAPRGLELCLELKPPPGDPAPLVEAVVALLARRRALSRTWLLCFAAAPLAIAHRLAPSLRLVRNTVALPGRPRAWLARQPPLAAVDACIDRLDPVRAAALRACGVELWTWTCTRPRHLALARRAGCTRAICDDPAWAQARA